jgi:hypothetical protein
MGLSLIGNISYSAYLPRIICIILIVFFIYFSISLMICQAFVLMNAIFILFIDGSGVRKIFEID